MRLRPTLLPSRLTRRTWRRGPTRCGSDSPPPRMSPDWPRLLRQQEAPQVAGTARAIPASRILRRWLTARGRPTRGRPAVHSALQTLAVPGSPFLLPLMKRTGQAARRCPPALPSIPALHPTERVSPALFRQDMTTRAPPARGHHVQSGETHVHQHCRNQPRHRYVRCGQLARPYAQARLRPGGWVGRCWGPPHPASSCHREAVPDKALRPGTMRSRLTAPIC